jgi:hypothetical protein
MGGHGLISRIYRSGARSPSILYGMGTSSPEPSMLQPVAGAANRSRFRKAMSDLLMLAFVAAAFAAAAVYAQFCDAITRHPTADAETDK